MDKLPCTDHIYESKLWAGVQHDGIESRAHLKPVVPLAYPPRGLTLFSPCANLTSSPTTSVSVCSAPRCSVCWSSWFGARSPLFRDDAARFCLLSLPALATRSVELPSAFLFRSWGSNKTWDESRGHTCSISKYELQQYVQQVQQVSYKNPASALLILGTYLS